MDKVWTANMDDTQKPYGQDDFKTCVVYRLNTVKSVCVKFLFTSIHLKKHGFYMDKLFSRGKNSLIKEEIYRYLVKTINLS